jgi:capsular exopolysaccharide synthesis family protein
MSEIFDLLKRTDTERKHKLPASEKRAVEPAKDPEPEYSAVVPVIEESLPKPEHSAAVPASEEPTPKEALICERDKFDLTEASQQVKRILDPLTLVGEQFRLLRSRLGLIQKQRNIKTILVTSAVPEEGKSFTASGLVCVFAQEIERKVLLIDADMRKPLSGYSFGLNGSGANAGLSEVLQGKVALQNALLRSMNPEFSFLSSGSQPSNPSELLGSANFESMLKTASENFDWIILDSPPIHTISETTILASLCDTVIFVVRANSTPVKLVEESVNRIGRDRICGIVLNRQKHLSSSRYYYKYYYRKSKP